MSNDELMNRGALPIGTVLGEFEIKGLIGRGGFGIVYLAYDRSLHREVALKEYMPSSLAERGDGTSVVLKSARFAETFRKGLSSFINEARLLAEFDHPSLVKVYRFWESHGTAYMVMPFYKGITLEEKLSLMNSSPDEKWLKRLLAQLLDAVSVIHAHDCYHRDIAPDNILIFPDGRPLLLDFGAARKVIADMAQELTVILKPGYAPIEQYANDPATKQGPWTDIYALAAVVYFAVTRERPPPSVSRVMSDSLIPLTKSAAGRYSQRFLQAIDQALSVKPENRQRNIDEFRTQLGLNKQYQDPQGTYDQTAAPEENKPGKRYIGVVLVVFAAIGAGILFLNGDTSSNATPEASGAPPAVQATPPGEKIFEPLKALNEIFENRDPSRAVTVSTEKAQTYIGKDPLLFRIHSTKPGYVYVLMVGTNHSDFFLLFPNAVDKDNYIKAGRQLDLPRPEWKITAEGPPGTDNFVVIVSDRPRDFAAAGLKAVDPFAQFPPEQAARLYRVHTGPKPLFAGKVICTDGASSCSESYGAAVFSIEEIRGS